MDRTFGKNLKAIREKEGISQKELGLSAGINYRHYQDIEAGKVDVKIGTAQSLARVLLIPMCYLYQANLNHILVNEDILCPVEILDFLPVGTLILDKNGRVIYSNRFFRQNFFNQSKGTIEKGEFYVWDLIHGDDDERQKAKERFNSVLNELPNPMPARWKYRGPNQEPIEVFVEWEYLKNHRGQVIHFVACLVATKRINMVVFGSDESENHSSKIGIK